MVNYLRGLIEVTYATTLTGWHGNKALGFTITCDDKKKTAVMSAPDSLLQVYNDLVGDEVKCSPKHIMSEWFSKIAEGVEPPKGDPDRASFLADQATARHGLVAGAEYARECDARVHWIAVRRQRSRWVWPSLV